MTTLIVRESTTRTSTSPVSVTLAYHPGSPECLVASQHQQHSAVQRWHALVRDDDLLGASGPTTGSRSDTSNGHERPAGDTGARPLFGLPAIQRPRPRAHSCCECQPSRSGERARPLRSLIRPSPSHARERETTVNWTIAALGLSALSSGLRAQSPDAAATSAQHATDAVEYRFADIPWGSPADSVKAALQREGIAYVATDSLGDLTFAGKVFQRDVAVIASMQGGGVARIVIGFQRAPKSLLPLYRAVKRELISKYGKPAKSTELFLPPYYEGDGNEDGAFLTKKAVFLTRWKSGATNDRLSLLVDERPGVMVVYESGATPNDSRRKP